MGMISVDGDAERDEDSPLEVSAYRELLNKI